MTAIVIAHRGASGYRPEHSQSAYLLASEMGADAVEPDVVLSSDGVPVVRHENEISGTTDVADRPEFARRRTVRDVDGRTEEGWFTEDLTWAELSTLRVRERLPRLRPGSASHDGEDRILRLSEVLAVCDRPRADGSRMGVVVEIKHATHFDQLGLDPVGAVAAELSAAGWSQPGDRLTVESFEPTSLGWVAERIPAARRILLVEKEGSPWDLIFRRHAGSEQEPETYADLVSGAGLDRLAGDVAGISVDKAMLVGPNSEGAGLVERAHRRGLDVYTWTLRPENAFLEEPFREGPPTAFGSWPEEFAAVLGTGVDGVFADHPDLALEARNGFSA